MISLPSSTRIWLVADVTDMRKSVSAPSATSCENCPVWQQSRPS
ncbi:transposase, partial [Escherichia coli]|nr:transposase [Escherichia coli]HAP0198244.1 transposase [Escherichia coli]